jgi:hypothetical protein
MAAMHWAKSWYARAWAFMVASLATLPAAEAQTGDPDFDAWQAARRDGSSEAYQRYLEDFPVGRYAGEAFRLLIQETIEDEQGGPPVLDATPMY